MPKIEYKIFVRDKGVSSERPIRDDELGHLQRIAAGTRGNICGRPIAQRILTEGGVFDARGIMFVGNTHMSCGRRGTLFQE